MANYVVIADLADDLCIPDVADLGAVVASR
jgi:hypothetical protein